MKLVILYDDLSWNSVEVPDEKEAYKYVLLEGEDVWDWYVTEAHPDADNDRT